MMMRLIVLEVVMTLDFDDDIDIDNFYTKL